MDKQPERWPGYKSYAYVMICASRTARFRSRLNSRSAQAAAPNSMRSQRTALVIVGQSE